MKKLLLCCIPLLFVFTSCDILGEILLAGLGGLVTEDKDLSFTGSGDDYLIQINSGNYALNSATWGNSRNAVNSENFTDVNLSDYFINDTSSIKHLIEQNTAIYSDSRAVTGDEVSFTTYITDSNIKNNTNPGSTKDFHILMDINGSECFATANAQLVTSNDYCNVWYVSKETTDKIQKTEEEKLNKFSSSTIKTVIESTVLNTKAKDNCDSLADKFSLLVNEEEKYFGKHEYLSHLKAFIPAQKRIDIIVYDILNDCNTTKTDGYIVGYFSSNDYVTKEYADYYYQNSGTVLETNSSQCIFVDSYFLAEKKEQAYSTLLHEYAHLLEHTNKIVTSKSPNANLKETWYSEMLAMLAEDLLNDYVGISSSAGPTSRLPLFLQSHVAGFTDWNKNASTLIYYANTYAYGAYLVRNYGGINLLKEIAGNQYFGEKSINAALSSVNNSNVTFADTVENEWQILFPGKKNIKYTLNKQITLNSSSSIKFKSIDINNYMTTDPTDKEKAYKENVYNDSKNSSYIFPQGFSVNKVGTNIDFMTVNGSKNLIYKTFVDQK